MGQEKLQETDQLVVDNLPNPEKKKGWFSFNCPKNTMTMEQFQNKEQQSGNPETFSPPNHPFFKILNENSTPEDFQKLPWFIRYRLSNNEGQMDPEKVKKLREKMMARWNYKMGTVNENGQYIPPPEGSWSYPPFCGGPFGFWGKKVKEEPVWDSKTEKLDEGWGLW